SFSCPSTLSDSLRNFRRPRHPRSAPLWSCLQTRARPSPRSGPSPPSRCLAARPNHKPQQSEFASANLPSPACQTCRLLHQVYNKCNYQENSTHVAKMRFKSSPLTLAFSITYQWRPASPDGSSNPCLKFLPERDDPLDKPIHPSGILNWSRHSERASLARVMLSLANSISASSTASRSLLSMSSVSTTTTIIIKTKTTGASGEGRN